MRLIPIGQKRGESEILCNKDWKGIIKEIHIENIRLS